MVGRYDARVAMVYTPPYPLIFQKMACPNPDTTPRNFFKFSNFFHPVNPKTTQIFTTFYDFFYIITHIALYNFMFFNTILCFFYLLTTIALTTFTIFSVVFWFFTIFLCCNCQRTVKYCYNCSWVIYPFLFLW